MSIYIVLGGLVLGALALALRGKWPQKRSFPPALAILALFLASRALLVLIALLVQGHYDGLSLNTLYTALSGPDSEHYLRIAEFGYQPGTDYENLIVFYPLYPLLVRALHFILRDYSLSGIVVSTAASLGGCYYLYGLVRQDHGRRAAFRSVKYLLLYPFSFFMLCIYTEGLFLLLSLGCKYYARRRAYALSALFGILCAFSRTQGVLVLLPAAYEALSQEILPAEGTLRHRLRHMPRKAWLLALIPAGFLGYLLLNHRLFGNALAFMAFQKESPWFQYLDFFPKNIEQHWSMGVLYPGLSGIIYFLQIALFFLGIWAVHDGAKRGMRLSLLLYGLAYTLVSYSAGWLISGGRYMLGCIPLFILLALRGRSAVFDTALTVFFACSNIFMFILFLLGYSIM